MLTDTTIEKRGIEALVKELGNVDALHEDVSIEELSKEAMRIENKYVNK